MKTTLLMAVLFITALPTAHAIAQESIFKTHPPSGNADQQVPMVQDTVNQATIEEAYIKKSGPNCLYVLRLVSGDRYEFFRFKDTVMDYDWGRVTRKGKRLLLSSVYKRKRCNFLEGKYIRINAKGVSHMRGRISLYPDTDNTADFEFGKHPISDEQLAVSGKKRLSTSSRTPIESAKAFYLSMAKKYYPGYVPVLEKAYCGPGYYRHFVDGVEIPWDEDTSFNKLMHTFGVVIHESIHMYNRYLDEVYFNDKGIKDSVWTLRHYHIKPGLTFRVHFGEYLKSDQVINPEDHPDIAKFHDYNTYINNDRASARGLGIYGLFEEYVAYKNELECMLKVYQNAGRKGHHRIQAQLKKRMCLEMDAFYTFHIYIGTYLKVVKKDHPTVYRSIMQNIELRTAFTLAEMEYKRVKNKVLGLYYGQDWVKLKHARYAPFLVAVQWDLDLFKIENLDSTKYEMVYFQR